MRCRQASHNNSVDFSQFSYYLQTFSPYKKSAELLLFLNRRFFQKYAKNGHFWPKKCPYLSAHVPNRLLVYFYPTHRAINLYLDRGTFLVGAKNFLAEPLIFLIFKKLSKVGVVFEKLKFLCFFSVFEPLENPNCYFKIEKALNK